MDECPTTSWFNLAEIRGDSQWSIYQGKESDPYGQGCGRRKRILSPPLGGSRFKGRVSFAGVAYSKRPFMLAWRCGA
jgi:hypothetical protein